VRSALRALDAAAKVLVLAGKPLNTKEMVETMLAKGLWKTGDKTPAATIYAAILREVRAKGKDARFRKTDRGQFEATAAARQ
jgi:restriction system protein